MKKTLFLYLTLLTSFTFLNSQIAQITNVSSWDGTFVHHFGKDINVDLITCPASITVEFDTEDTYSFEQVPGINILSPIGTTIEIEFFQDFDLFIPSFEIYDSRDSVVATVSIHILHREIDSIRLQEGLYTPMQDSDTLLICSNHIAYTPQLQFIDEFQSEIPDCYGPINVYLNEEPPVFIDIASLFTLDLNDGDSLYFEMSGDITCSCSHFYANTIKSKTYHVKEITNEKVDITAILEGNTTICPRESITLAQSVATVVDYDWYKNNSRIYNHKSDTLNVKIPGKYFMIESNSLKVCPSISETYYVKKGENCSSYVSGYVKEKDSYDPSTGLYNTFAGVTVRTNTGLVTVSDQNGFFEFTFPENAGVYQVHVADNDYYEDREYTYFYAPADFRLAENTDLYTYLLEQNDLAVYLGSGRNRPGFTIPYTVTVENRGKNQLTTDVNLVLDDHLTYTSLDGEDTPLTVNGQSLSWTNITVPIGETRRLRFYAVLDRLTPLETVLTSTVDLNQLVEDDKIENNSFIHTPEVTGSFDPNDKLVSFNGAFTDGYVYDTTQFEYTIRFQNTGTDTAFTVRVEDVISEHLDLTTINVLDASHSYKMTIDNDTVNWIFNDILLVDSTTNEPASHGFVRFTIDQKQTNEQGTVITNKAGIYFDFNDPIITNETMSIVDNRIVTSIKKKKTTKSSNLITVFPNPAVSTINVKSSLEGTLELYNEFGQIELITTNKESIDISVLDNGVYYYQFKTAKEVFSGSLLKN